MSAGGKSSRVGSFDTLRLIFAILVILSHSFALVSNGESREPMLLLTHGQLTLGNFSVLAFFAISGFLISSSWTRCPSPVEFLLRRVSRIFPAFVVSALVSLILIVPIAGGGIPHSMGALPDFGVRTLTLQQFTHPPIFLNNEYKDVLNGSLWSVRTEFWCYIVLMFLGMTNAIRRRSLVLMMLFGSIGWHFYMLTAHQGIRTDLIESTFGSLIDWSNVLPCFLAGLAFHQLGGTSLLTRNRIIAAAFALIASSFVPFAYVITMPVCGTYLLMAVAFSQSFQPLNLGRYGDFSYGTYLYAFPIQQLIVMWLGKNINPITLFLLAAPASIVMGMLSWILVERRFLSRRAVREHTGHMEEVKETSCPNPIRESAAVAASTATD